MDDSGTIRTTEALPSEIQGFPKGKRNRVVHEIYQSEYTYVHGLEVLIDVGVCMYACTVLLCMYVRMYVHTV